MKGIVTKTILYFLLATMIYMGVTSFTNKMLPSDSSVMVGTFFGFIVFIGAFILDWIFNRKSKEKK